LTLDSSHWPLGDALRPERHVSLRSRRWCCFSKPTTSQSNHRAIEVLAAGKVSPRSRSTNRTLRFRVRGANVEQAAAEVVKTRPCARCCGQTLGDRAAVGSLMIRMTSISRRAPRRPWWPGPGHLGSTPAPSRLPSGLPPPPSYSSEISLISWRCRPRPGELNTFAQHDRTSSAGPHECDTRGMNLAASFAPGRAPLAPSGPGRALSRLAAWSASRCCISVTGLYHGSSRRQRPGQETTPWEWRTSYLRGNTMIAGRRGR